MRKYLLIAILLLIPNQGKAETCFAEAKDLKQVHPDAYPSWTTKMTGHRGERCWFPSTRSDKKWHAPGKKQESTKTLKLNTDLSYAPTLGVLNATQLDSDVAPQKSYTRGIKTDVPMPPEIPNAIKIKQYTEKIKYYVEGFEALNQIDRFDKWARGLF